MTDYTKATEFTPKDSLPTGDPAKIIKGADFDTEFDAIETSIATKVDIVPSLSVGALLTAAIGGQLSDDKTAALDAFLPVESLHFSTNSANPATYFGAGTWQSFSEGRVIMGAGASTVDANGDTISAVAGERNGEFKHTLTEAELAPHDHPQRLGGNGEDETVAYPSYSDSSLGTTPAVVGNGTEDAGGGAAHNNEQPSMVVYIWKRVA